MSARKDFRYRGHELVSPRDLPEENKKLNAREQYLKRLQGEWDSLLWIFAAFAVLYYFEFASNVLFNEKVDRLWAVVSTVTWIIAICCGAHVATRSPKLDATNWFTSPSPTLAFVSGIFGTISFMLAVWGVWRYWTLMIVTVLFMGLISTISMFNL